MVDFSATRSQYAMLGRMLCRARPDVATELLESLKPGEQTDLNRIYFFYSRLSDWRPEGLREVEARRIFIAAMLLLFNPNFFVNNAVKTVYGFNQRIADCFACKRQSVKRTIGLVRVRYRHYDDFKSQADSLVEYFRTVT